MVCDGVLPIDQLREYIGPVGLVVKRLPRELLEATYGLTIKERGAAEGGDGKVRADDFLQTYASKWISSLSRTTANLKLALQSLGVSQELAREIRMKPAPHDGS